MKRTHRDQSSLPVVLTIGGSDCSGGAGIQADLRTFDLLALEGLNVATCLVTEDTREVRGIQVLPVDLLREQLDFLSSSYQIQGVKIGVLPTVKHVEAVGNFLKQNRVWSVLDPVLSATAGAVSFSEDQDELCVSLCRLLMPLTTLVTPNWLEWKQIEEVVEKVVEREKGKKRKETIEERMTVIADILGTSILLKGGHCREEKEARDRLLDQTDRGKKRVQTFSSPWVSQTGEKEEDQSPHGTGCVLASAITGYLSLGENLSEAVRKAKVLMTHAILEASDQKGQRPTLLRGVQIFSPEQ